MLHRTDCVHGLHTCRRAEEARHAAIIAAERRKLLEAAMAADLADFLPPGVLKDKTELEFMRGSRRV